MIGFRDDPPVVAGAFAAAPDGSHWTYSGALTFANAAAVLEASQGMALPAAGRIDMSGIGTADSSALAVLLALKRRASRERRRLSVEGLPQALAALSRVYGVEDLIAA